MTGAAGLAGQAGRAAQAAAGMTGQAAAGVAGRVAQAAAGVAGQAGKVAQEAAAVALPAMTVTLANKTAEKGFEKMYQYYIPSVAPGATGAEVEVKRVIPVHVSDLKIKLEPVEHHVHHYVGEKLQTIAMVGAAGVCIGGTVWGLERVFKGKKE